MRAAEEELKRRLTEIFIRLPLVPDGLIASIDTTDWCEDRRTFIVWLTMQDGSEVHMQFCPGEAISVSVRDVG